MPYLSRTVTHIFSVNYWCNIDMCVTGRLVIENCAIRRLWYVLSRVNTLTRDTDIANLSVRPSTSLSVCLSVRDVPVSDENGLTYCQSF